MSEKDLSKALADSIKQRIAQTGPLTFRDWMEIALYDPHGGYYTRANRERWGRQGDYRTSPERTPLFAATLARYFAALHQGLGSPEAWTIIEAGAGQGDFASDLLETLQRSFPAVFAATNYLVDEISVESQSRISSRIHRFIKKVQFVKIRDLDQIQAGVIFSNELFDSFPVHRVTMIYGLLQELYVGLSASDQFVWVTGPPSREALSQYLEDGGIKLVEGQTAEINLEIEPWLSGVAQKLERGFVITLDYGAEAGELYAPKRTGGTLRSFSRHMLTDDVLARCGEQDITSSVDWSLVQRVAAKVNLRTVAFKRLDQFLLETGIVQELEARLSEADDEGAKAEITTAAREMILPTGMGSSFQVLVQEKVSGN